MALKLTRGGLSPAKIINLSTKDEVKFMFNPFEYSLKKSNTWEKESGKGQNAPRQNFLKGGEQTLSLKLHFDSLADKSDVRKYTNPLWKMMMIEESTKNQRSGKSSPPAVAFEWGRLYFKAIITSMTQSFTLFGEDGTPLRCTVDVSLEQYVEEDSSQPLGQGAPSSTTVVEGDRMDNVGGGNYRDVATNNNINNPLNVPSGTVLKV